MVVRQVPSPLASTAPLASAIGAPSLVDRLQATLEWWSPTAPQPTPETVTAWLGA